MIGIYCIENIVNNKKYIGQSESIKDRWDKHKNFLRNNKHCNKKLQNAWNFYGENSFIFYVIEECSIEDINQREIYWIDFYDTLNSGYNLCFGGDGIRGYKHTPEEIQKMIKVQNPKSVYQLTIEHCVVNEFPSASTASKRTGFSRRGIEAACNRVNKQKTIGGYIWVWKDEYDNGLVDWDYYDDYKRSFPIKVKMFSLDGMFLKEYPSYYSTKNDGFNPFYINNCVRRKNYISQGYIWIPDGDEYKFDIVSYIVIDVNTNNVRHFSYKQDVCREYHIAKEKLVSCCNNGLVYKGKIYKMDIKTIVCR